MIKKGAADAASSEGTEGGSAEGALLDAGADREKGGRGVAGLHLRRQSARLGCETWWECPVMRSTTRLSRDRETGGRENETPVYRWAS